MLSEISVTSPKGKSCELLYREHTSDLAVIGSTWNMWGKLDDEYGLAQLPPLARAYDIGAHIGSVTCALLADHPDVEVIAVEPLRENVEVLLANAEHNGWLDRLRVITGAVSDSTLPVPIGYDYLSTDIGRTNRYIGNLHLGADGKTVTVPGVTLKGMLRKYGRPDFVKIDCEGGEWAYFQGPVAKLPLIHGEAHGTEWLDALDYLLGKTHFLTVSREAPGAGNFRAVRRG